jgi:cytochrome c551/c552
VSTEYRVACERRTSNPRLAANGLRAYIRPDNRPYVRLKTICESTIMRPVKRSRTTLIVLTAAVFTVAACGGEGHEIYVEAGCVECHGDDLRGTPTSGPTLKGIKKHWDEETLLIYFRKPDSVASEDPRLSELRDIYGEGMPPLKMADPIAREKLARYVLR